MKHTRIFSLIGVVVATVAVLAALMTSIAVAHTNILAELHAPLQPIDVDGDGDAESFLANLHVFENDRAEGTIQWKDTNSRGILNLWNGQVSCVEDRPTLSLRGTLSTWSQSGEPGFIRDVAVTIASEHEEFPNRLVFRRRPIIFWIVSGILAFTTDPCE